MRWTPALALGLGSYLLFLLLNIPAQQALGWAMQGQALTLTGASGTIWSGEADRASFNHIPLGQLKWRFSPLSLLSGRVGYAIELQDAGEKLSGILQTRLGGSYRLRNLQGLILADRLPQLMQQHQIRITGKIDLDQVDLDISNKRLASATGRIRWQAASVSSPLALKVGDLQAEITTEEDGSIKAQIKNLGGTTVIKAEAGLNTDGNFRIDGSVKPGNGADPGLSSALQAIGRKKPDGSFQLKYAGKI
jgi:general secretion pathway protein N